MIQSLRRLSSASIIPALNRATSRVLISKKRGDTRARDAQLSLMRWLEKRSISFDLDADDNDNVDLIRSSSSSKCSLKRASDEDPPDLIVTLGGDGTVLRAVDSFVGANDDSCESSGSSSAPPVVAFAVGSLGFLTPHAFGDFESVLNRVFDSESFLAVTRRSRLYCEVFEENSRCVSAHRVLNECLVARGSRSSFHRLDVSVDGQFVAQFQADGLILATPSGSSAYSLAVGGSLVAPTVPAILLTPVAPHSLSTRPLILPESAVVEISVANGNRSPPVVSFDGKHEKELIEGMGVRIQGAGGSVPFIRNAGSPAELSEWFTSLRSKLHWAHELRPLIRV